MAALPAGNIRLHPNQSAHGERSARLVLLAQQLRCKRHVRKWLHAARVRTQDVALRALLACKLVAIDHPKGMGPFVGSTIALIPLIPAVLFSGLAGCTRLVAIAVFTVGGGDGLLVGFG